MYNTGNTALVLINNFEVHNGHSPVVNYEEVSEKIRSLYLAFQAVQLTIFSVSDSYFSQYEYKIPHKAPAYEDKSMEIILGKQCQSCFSDPGFLNRLRELHIEEVIITGYSTDKSIAASVMGGLEKEFRITLASDAHSTVYSNLGGKNTIEAYNHIWRDMSRKNSRLSLLPTEDLLERF